MRFDGEFTPVFRYTFCLLLLEVFGAGREMSVLVL
jgi:hypothetical protein